MLAYVHVIILSQILTIGHTHVLLCRPVQHTGLDFDSPFSPQVPSSLCVSPGSETVATRRCSDVKCNAMV